MQLGKIEYTILGITAILVIFAGINIYHLIDNAKNPYKSQNIGVVYINTSETEKIKIDVAKLSKKYKAYENLYNSDKKVFAYSYTQNTFNKKDNPEFHKKLSQALEKAKLNYDVVVYKNLNDYDKDVEIQNSGVYNNDPTKCMMENPSVQELNALRKVSKDCLINACIIDMKNKEYTIMTRDINYIISVLKKNNK